ncbi:oxidoreductase, aldo/keto reductase family protein [Bifidobacterium actinocoloniiforme DSM 22766]|uniref:Oxidoreductase, aldo/keto reductase family protein n=1 Tax=Bifidobacterium actinocoloniiforme DSM 22766 TaxID=1437605 RepID=A0A086Z1T2_9BIFI|nr:aldo/keto reductase [Bifidobacterium actinocoloniiforme]AKV55590.1 oxidoreductase [Bifidobacterium actinocoloniiforme DSM 22766]KFI40482.1 oxidoreductase, aldo/keto reductase family protein [Bifidobacterium actinocoloniiforme DSM 22766]
MQYTKLGNSGLDVSRICLGSMGFGTPGNDMFPWAVGAEDSEAVVKQALDLGINFFDTANIYSYGDSERYLGQALKKNAKRDEVVVATKVFFTHSDKPNQHGLSRKAIMHQIDQSLERLCMDYVDLYIIHRWDYRTPIEETMEALHDLVKAGKVRYLGASAMYAWQFEKAQFVAASHNWTPFISMQSHMNLLYREEEREMLPLCQDENVAVTPYSPLASGRLTRQWSAQTKRYQSDQVARGKYDHTESQDMEIVERVHHLAGKYEAPMVQVALAWLLHKPQVAAPIIGAHKPDHVRSAVDALNLDLTPDDMAYLEEPYLPHTVTGPWAPDQTDFTR